MGLRNQAAILWQGFTKKKPPRSVGEIVEAAGGTRAAARLAGVAQRTIQKWRREEHNATSDVKKMVRTIGGRAQAAAAAGVSERTIRRWEQQEREGRTPGPRQQGRINRLQQAAVRAHTAKVQRRPGVVRMQEGVLNDREARRRAVSSRRANRISNSGGRVQMSAYTTVVSTDYLEDSRNRSNIDVELEGPVMREPMQEWMNGGDSDAVLDKMSKAFTQHYLQSDPNAKAAGAKWRFDGIQGMKISQRTPGASTFKYRD